MALSPFYNVTVENTNTDITHWISEFRYEDATEEDDIIVLKIPHATIQQIDSPELKKGNTLTYVYGFLGQGRKSKIGTAQIKDIECDYGISININVTAKDKGYSLKRETSKAIYEGKTGSEIALQIAVDFKMDSVIEETTKVHDSLPQGGKTYWEFLKVLAKKEGDAPVSPLTPPALAGTGKGPFQVFVKGNTLTFARRDLKTDAEIKYLYSEGEGIVKSFRPSYEQSQDGASVAVESENINPDDMSGFESKMNDSEPKARESNLGQETINYDVNGVELGRSAVKQVFTPSTDQEEADNFGSALKKEGTMGELVGTMDLDLDPSVQSDRIITMGGVARIHQGNWYIKKATHTISKGTASTTLDLAKNASASGEELAEGDVNETIGDENPDAKGEIKIFKYDVNGILIDG